MTLINMCSQCPHNLSYGSGPDSKYESIFPALIKAATKQKEAIAKTNQNIEPLNLIDFKNAFEDIEDQKRLMEIWDYLVYNRHILTIKDED